MTDLDKYSASRLAPVQARGKERVRVILAAASELFKVSGIDQVTTNDIAAHAGVPIGSVYRYFHNKEAIIMALAELYSKEVAALLDAVADHPLLKHLTWQEIMLLAVSAWGEYSRLNGPFPFLYFQKSEPRVSSKGDEHQRQIVAACSRLLTRRCPKLGALHVTIVCRFMWTAQELGSEPTSKGLSNHQLSDEAVRAIAGYLDLICDKYD